MKYRVKMSYPTLLEIGGKEYLLYPGQEIDLPDAEIVQTYVGLGYIEPVEQETKKKKEEVKNAS